MKKTTMILLFVLMLSVVSTVLVLAKTPDAADSPFLSGYEVVSDTSVQDSSASKEISVACPPGKFVIGGGANVFGVVNGLALTASAPEGMSSQPNEWYAAAQEVVSNPHVWSLRVYAICASIVSDYQLITQVTDSNSDGVKSVTAECPQGTSVISGGARISGILSATMLSTSGPDGTQSQPDKWYAVAQRVVTSRLPWSLRVDVICANLPDYEVVTDSTAANDDSLKTASPKCLSGKIVVGGGARIFGTINGTGLKASGPDGPQSLPDGWSASGLAYGIPSFPSWGIRGDVICAREQDPDQFIFLPMLQS